MNREKLDKILEDHKEWFKAGGVNGKRANLCRANLCSADLSYADLRGADLCGADIDFSCFPLWCGGLDVHIDDKQAIQLLYHLLRNVMYSKNTSDEMKKILSTEAIIKKANEFHRVGECGEIKMGGE